MGKIYFLKNYLKIIIMARPLDYNKWNNIEVSDDEDDTHPNIDTPSLFKWRHEARVKRMEEMDAKKKFVTDEKKKKEQEIEALKKKMATTALSESEMKIIQKGLNELEKEANHAKEKMKEVIKAEHPHLACEETANYLVIHCLNLEMQNKHEAMKQVAHQCICVQYLLELSKQLDVDPRSCISSFFTKIQIADNEYKKAFQDELDAFIERIEIRAEQKIEEQMVEAQKEAQREEELDKEARLGPGGLDPVEVFESLPDALKECFESHDIAKLQECIKAMNPEDARHHMKRCVDSGLWKPSADDPDTNPEDGFKRGAEPGDSQFEDSQDDNGDEGQTDAAKPEV